jgi:hypothetical protein
MLGLFFIFFSSRGGCGLGLVKVASTTAARARATRLVFLE